MSQFFASLKKTGIQQIGMSISYDGDKVSVSILPKSNSTNKGLKSMSTLNLCGSVEEMDRLFFEKIQEPMEKTKEVFDNVESYEASLNTSKGKTEGAKKGKDTISKKLSALQSFIKGKDFNAMKDYEKAIEMSNEIIALNPDHKEAKKTLEQMNQYAEPQLF